jgi:hypothetical protein
LSLLGKLQFWKKDDEFASPTEAPHTFDLGSSTDPLQTHDPLQSNPFQTQQSFEQQGFSQQPSSFAQYPQGTAFPGRQQPAPVPEQYQEHQDQGIHPRDVELILAKLDAIKSELDALHQRVRKIEQVNDNQVGQQKKYW